MGAMGGPETLTVRGVVLGEFLCGYQRSDQQRDTKEHEGGTDKPGEKPLPS